MNTIIVNPVLCNGCQTCYKSCFVDVIRWDRDKRLPVIAYPQECVHCNYCQLNCKQRAIKVVPDYAGYMFPEQKVHKAKEGKE